MTATWDQVAVIYIFTSLILSGIVQVVNIMGPVPIIEVGDDSFLSSFFLQEQDLEILKGSVSDPNPIIGSSAPSEVLGFLAPGVKGIIFVGKAIFTIFNSWTLVLYTMVDVVGVSRVFLYPIVPAILLMNVLSLLVILRELKLPFLGGG